MKLSMWFKKIRSYFTSKPIPVGYGLSCDESIHLKVDPSAKLSTAEPGKLWFYRVRDDLGAFEVQSVVINRDGSMSYVVYHPDTDQYFKVKKNFYDLLFEPIPMFEHTSTH